MWISIQCGCGGSNGYCCHCGGAGFTWRIASTERRPDNESECIEWIHCPLCSARIHRGNFLAHLEITHQTTWDAVERLVASMTSLSSHERPAQRPAGYSLSGDSLKRISDELNLAVAYLIPRHNILRLMRNLLPPKRQAHNDEASSKIVLDYLLP